MAKRAVEPTTEKDATTPEQSGGDVLTTYSNHISMRSSVYDIALTFGIDVGSGITPTATVLMSPQHARSLKLLLDRYLADYERNVGPIPLSADIIERLTLLEPEEAKPEAS